MGAIARGQPPGLDLRQDRKEILPAEGASGTFNDIVIVAATPGLGAFAGSFESGIENRLGKRTHRLTDLAVLFEVDEVADPVSHLAFGFFDEKGFAHSHQGRPGLTGNGIDVAGDEGVVGGGGDDGSVHGEKGVKVKQSNFC